MNFNFSAIYGIKNKIDGKIYIGSAINIRHRWRIHLRQLQNNTHHSIKLQRAWNKYGENTFEFLIIEKVEDKNKLIEREQYWLDEKLPFKNGYNISPTAGSRRGVPVSEDTRAVLRKYMEGKPSPMKGKKHKQESLTLMSTKAKGRVSPMKGKKHTKEAKIKNAEAHKGKTHTKEAIQKVKDFQTGRPKTEEHKAALRKFHADRKAQGIPYKRSERAYALDNSTYCDIIQ